MAGSRSAGGPRKPLTNLSTPRIEPKAEKSKVSSRHRTLNRRPKSANLTLNRPEPSRNVSLLSGRVSWISLLDQLNEASEESRRLKERKATLPDIRLLPTQNFPNTLPTVPVRSTNTEPQSLKSIREELAADCGWKTGHHVFAEGEQVPFVVLNFLGMGSLGVVEEVTSQSSPKKGTQTLARKRVLLPYHGRRQRLQIIKEEANVLEDLAHQHIIQMIASYEDTPQPGKFFYSLLMSPVGDNDLKTFLDVVGDQDRAPQEKLWLRQWFSCLTAALAYLHGQGVRHQDIKPSNIIHRNSHIFFTDFSSSSRFEVGQTTSTENPARTSAMYGAPEMIDVFQDNGKLKRHGRAADIFSLGAVFSEMLSVIDGRAVNKYHEFLSQSHALTGSQGAEAARGLLYGQSVDKVTQWFSTSGQRNVRRMFADLVAPMLCLDREDRPEAALLLDLLLARRPFTYPCHCQLLYSSRSAQASELAKEDRGLLEPEARSGTHSEQLISFKDYYSNDEILLCDIVVSLRAYQPRANGEFELERGDMIKVVGLWNDGWATGVKLAEAFEQWEPSEANSSTIQGDSEMKAFPLVCVCLLQHWRRTIEGEPIKS